MPPVTSLALVHLRFDVNHEAALSPLVLLHHSGGALWTTDDERRARNLGRYPGHASQDLAWWQRVDARDLGARIEMGSCRGSIRSWKVLKS
jgi:hypothetical protein